MKGYSQLWKRNLGALVIVVVFLGAIAGAVIWTRGTGNSGGAGTGGGGGGGSNPRFVRFVVNGPATARVHVSYSDKGGGGTLDRNTRLPFSASVRLNPNALPIGLFYAVRAFILKGGYITCQVTIGGAAADGRAAGAGNSCAAQLNFARDAGWYTG